MLGDRYVSRAELKNYIGISVDNESENMKLDDALLSTTMGINLHCHRQFNKAGAVTSRRYRPKDCELAKVADFHTTVGLVIATDDDDDGVFETVWSASDYELEPLDGIVDGEIGWPYWEIRAVGSRRFPTRNRRAALRVSSDWGWAAVPEPVRTACRIVSEETYKLAEAPFGVAGFAEFGVMRVRDNQMAAKKLEPYRLDPILVA